MKLERSRMLEEKDERSVSSAKSDEVQCWKNDREKEQEEVEQKEEEREREENSQEQEEKEKEQEEKEKREMEEEHAEEEAEQEKDQEEKAEDKEVEHENEEQEEEKVEEKQEREEDFPEEESYQPLTQPNFGRQRGAGEKDPAGEGDGEEEDGFCERKTVSLSASCVSARVFPTCVRHSQSRHWRSA